MRYKVFVDTNILLSGIFFEGNESRLLDLVEIDLITSADNVAELRKVIVKKLKYLKERSLEIALAEADRALGDIEIIHPSKYSKKMREASLLITHKKDIPILAAVLAAKPDYFLTGDTHFLTEKVKGVVSVISAKEFLEKMKRN
jgi:predicted nucleic acid-binding protein